MTEHVPLPEVPESWKGEGYYQCVDRVVNAEIERNCKGLSWSGLVERCKEDASTVALATCRQKQEDQAVLLGEPAGCLVLILSPLLRLLHLT